MSFLDRKFVGNAKDALAITKTVALPLLAVSLINVFGAATDSSRWDKNTPLNAALLGGYLYCSYRFARHLLTPTAKFNIHANDEANALYVRTHSTWNTGALIATTFTGTTFQVFDQAPPMLKFGTLAIGGIALAGAAAMQLADQRKIKQLTQTLNA